MHARVLAPLGEGMRRAVLTARHLTIYPHAKHAWRCLPQTVTTYLDACLHCLPLQDHRVERIAEEALNGSHSRNSGVHHAQEFLRQLVKPAHPYGEGGEVGGPHTHRRF